MSRKNQRDERWLDPLDVEAIRAAMPKPPKLRETQAEYDARVVARTVKRWRERVTKALAGRWADCCIPGCTEKSMTAWYMADPHQAHDVDERLPVCFKHALIVASMLNRERAEEDVQAARAELAERRRALRAVKERRHDLYYENGAADAHVYFVRVGDLIKVGWSSRLRSRLKAYSADSEVLLHYPATRQEETDMHRLLRPDLAKGREWYRRDGPLVQRELTRLLKKHGEPTIFADWTEPQIKGPTITPRGWSGGRAS